MNKFNIMVLSKSELRTISNAVSSMGIKISNEGKIIKNIEQYLKKNPDSANDEYKWLFVDKTQVNINFLNKENISYSMTSDKFGGGDICRVNSIQSEDINYLAIKTMLERRHFKNMFKDETDVHSRHIRIN